MVEEIFQVTKGLAICVSLAMIGILQVYCPFKTYQELDSKTRLKNAAINLALAFTNIFILQVLCGSCLLKVAQSTEATGMGLTHGWPLALRFLVSLLALDFTAYFWHRVNHRVNFLWRYHQVHHSDEIYDGTTAFRFHFGEVAISLGVRLGVVVALGLPWEGILFFEVLYGFANVFQHGSFTLPRGVEACLQWIFITPGLHRKHHSCLRHHLDRNFGTIFSFWDHLGGSFIPGFSTEDEFPVGLPKDQGFGKDMAMGKEPRVLGVGSLLLMPFVRGR